jgi:predicted porin
MKKSLLALAAMSAVAGAAQAQSSVNVYGILDVGFVASNYNGTSLNVNAASNSNSTSVGAAGQSQHTAGFGQSAESTSRLGFKGNEDLGGGLAAVFTVEMALSPNGTADWGTATGGINRQTFVGLKKNGLGTASIGTQYTPIFDVQSITDAAGNNNLLGNAMYQGTLQSTSGTFNSGLSPYGGNSSLTQSLSSTSGNYTTRASNAIKFQSDRFAGFAGQVFYSQANTSSSGANSFQSASSTASAGTNNNTAWGVNGDYVWNKLQVVAAYQNFRSYDPALPNISNATTYNALAGGTGQSWGVNMTDSTTYAAATYDFGILKAYYQFMTRKASAVQDSSYSTKRLANQIGVRSQLTPVVSAYATYGLTNSTYFGQSLPAANGRTFQVGVDYYLSKRTNLYVAGGAANQSSNGTVAAGTTNVGAGSSGNNYAVGIRHTF